MVYESIDHGNDVTCQDYVTQCAQDFPGNFTGTENKCCGKKTNPSQFSMVYTLIDHRNDAIKCSKLCSETTRLRLVVPLEFSTFYDIISMVYNV